MSKKPLVNNAANPAKAGDDEKGKGRVRKTIDISKVEFQDNVPVARVGATGVYAARINEMKVGQSFLISLEQRDAVAGIASAMKKLGFKCTSREMKPGTVEDLGNGKTMNHPDGAIRIHKENRVPRTKKTS